MVLQDALSEDGVTLHDMGNAQEHRNTTDDGSKSVLISRHYTTATIIFTICIQLAAIGLLITVIPAKIWLHKVGSASNTQLVLYATGITVGATLISTLINSSIRTLWLIKAAYRPHRRGDTGSLQQRLETLLGLAGFDDRFYCYPITLSWMLTGLITASLVAGLTFSTTDTYFSAQNSIFTMPDSDLGSFGYDCVTTADSPQPAWAKRDWLHWPHGSGSSYLSVDISSCGSLSTISYILQNFAVQAAGLNNYEPGQPTTSDYAYAIGGVAVKKSAVGTPYHVFQLLQTYGLNTLFNTVTKQDMVSPRDLAQLTGPQSTLQSLTQCFPVVASNPVRCQTAGSGGGGPRTTTVTADANFVNVTSPACNASASITTTDPEFPPGGIVAGVCANATGIGRASIVIGGMNGFDSGAAQQLADSVWSDLPPASSDNDGQQTYAVTCEVDVAPHLALRSLTFNTTGQSISQSAPGWDACAALNQDLSLGKLVSNVTLAYGLAGLYPLLSGDLSTLWGVTGSGQSHPAQAQPGAANFVFNNSQNPIEDALGLAIAVNMGYFWGIDGVSPVVSSGRAQAVGTRVGTGSWIAILLTIPLLYSLILLTYLWWQVRNMSRMPFSMAI